VGNGRSRGSRLRCRASARTVVWLSRVDRFGWRVGGCVALGGDAKWEGACPYPRPELSRPWRRCWRWRSSQRTTLPVPYETATVPNVALLLLHAKNWLRSAEAGLIAAANELPDFDRDEELLVWIALAQADATVAIAREQIREELVILNQRDARGGSE
jgi:hypothetical protein